MAFRGQQFKILLAVISLGFLGGAIVGVAYFWEQVIKPEKVALETIKVQQKTPQAAPDPGFKDFQASLDLVRDGDLFAARDRLTYLMRYYPESSKYEEAKRVLGEINLDLLLSDSPAPGKVKYTIVKGDYGLSTVARKNRCTLDYIMKANGLTGTTIHYGDQFWVTPLNFVMEVNVVARSLTVYRLEAVETVANAPAGTEPAVKEIFFKEYRVIDLNLPPTIKVPSATQVSDKPGWLPNGRRAKFGTTEYHSAHRWLQTKRPGLVVQAVPEDAETASFERKTGVLLAQADVNELYTFIRTGTEIRLAE